MTDFSSMNRALRPILAYATVTLTIGAGISSLCGLPAVAQSQGKAASAAASQALPPRSVIQKLRDFLGLNPPVAVGGSRSGSELAVCLLSPWPGQPIGLTTPVLQAAGPLNEIRIEQGDRLLWERRASSTQAIEGPILWPIQPLKAGAELTLKIRPRGASGGDFAVFRFRVADAATLESNAQLASALGHDAKAWSRAIDQLKPGQQMLATALLSSPHAAPELRSAIPCSSR
jgi:hypothetical protein